MIVRTRSICLFVCLSVCLSIVLDLIWIRNNRMVMRARGVLPSYSIEMLTTPNITSLLHARSVAGRRASYVLHKRLCADRWRCAWRWTNLEMLHTLRCWHAACGLTTSSDVLMAWCVNCLRIFCTRCVPGALVCERPNCEAGLCGRCCIDHPRHMNPICAHCGSTSCHVCGGYEVCDACHYNIRDVCQYYGRGRGITRYTCWVHYGMRRLCGV